MAGARFIRLPSLVPKKKAIITPTNTTLMQISSFFGMASVIFTSFTLLLSMACFGISFHANRA